MAPENAEKIAYLLFKSAFAAGALSFEEVVARNKALVPKNQKPLQAKGGAMKRIGLLMAVLCGFIFNGCANRRQEYQEYYKQFEINEQRAFRFSPLNNAEKDEVKIQILKENGFYYYNADVKKCYWVVLIFHGVSFDAVDCAAVFDLLINKGEYNQPAEKY